MSIFFRLGFALSLLAITFAATTIHAGEWTGYIQAEVLAFDQDGLSDQQHQSYLSVAAEPEYYVDLNDGRDSLTFKPFIRIDQHDSERTHFDIRELSWITAHDNWELRAGISKVFWGVTESVHLVDIINQTDQVENTDGEDKLGQGMINLSLIRDWGVVDLFVLPGFRPRTFPSPEGRTRLSIPIDADDQIYSTRNKEKHVDYAIRWSHSIGDWDIGIAHFSGISREPVFVPVFDTFGRPVKLIPKYDTIDQTSIDVQATLGSWLWKLEAFTRSGQGDRFYAAAAGFEYTFVGLRESDLDLGVVAEYLYDERGDTATTPFEDDLFLGARLTFNDTQSTEVLAGIIKDLDSSEGTYNVEASRRFGDRWKLSMEIRGNFRSRDPRAVLHTTRKDDSLRLELARYF